MFYVYLLRSQSSPERVYTGFTEDLRQRLAELSGLASKG